MQRPLRLDRDTRSIRELVTILCLVLVTWYLAELSNGMFDSYAKASLIPALGLVACAVRLWQKLQQERDLRRQAELLLRATHDTLPATVPDAATPAPVDPNVSVSTLTERETEVLALIASSCTNQR